ncbi:hypothetical protein AMTRI_Chr05g60750 [Amborella trichopoda]
MVLCMESFLLYYDEKGENGLFSKNNFYTLPHKGSAQSFLKNKKIIFITISNSTFFPQHHQGDDLHFIRSCNSLLGNKDAWEVLALKHFIFLWLTNRVLEIGM